MMFCAVWLTAQIAHDNDQLEDAFYEACAADVQVEIDRWPNFCQGVRQWLANYPATAHYPIFRPAVLEGKGGERAGGGKGQGVDDQVMALALHQSSDGNGKWRIRGNAPLLPERGGRPVIL